MWLNVTIGIDGGDERDVRAEPGELRGIDVPVVPEIVQTAAIVGPNKGTIPATSGFTVYRVRGTTIDDGTFVPLDP
jgi:hypothetical protein